MKTIFKVIGFVAFFHIFHINAQTPTAGNLLFSFKPVDHTTPNFGKLHNLAVWIQTENGDFVKTRMRYAGALTNDHLPNWAVNAGGPANNCLSPLCNVVDAITGASKNDYDSTAIQWDGTDTLENLMEDGNYQVTLEACWIHGDTGKCMYSYPFMKGPDLTILTPTDNADYTDVVMVWQPNNVGLNAIDNSKIAVFPNPVEKGLVSLSFNKANYIQILGSNGLVLEEYKIDKGQSQVDIDVSTYPAGVYFFKVIDRNKSFVEKFVVAH